jgi:hypothetical protein
MTVRSLLGRAYRTSLADAVRGTAKLVKERIAGPVERSPMTAAFLRSHDYDELMTRHLPCDGSFDLHEAQNQTRSYQFRHGEAAPRLGVFRWRGMQKHRDRVLALIEKAEGGVLDFGGAGGPLGLGSVVVDQLDRDALGRPVELHSLADARGRASVVFSSHALEHVPPLDEVLQQMRESLMPGGALIVHVPSYFCERWRAGLHSNERFNDHVWTFGLEDSPRITGLQGYANIATRIEAFFNVELAEYCGDDSIFVLAHAA